MCSVFYFQAEDGIRDYKVTGVQTCALPISGPAGAGEEPHPAPAGHAARRGDSDPRGERGERQSVRADLEVRTRAGDGARSEEHTSELQSPCNLVCRLLLEKKNTLETRGTLL